MNILKINGTAISGIYVDAAVSFNKPAKRVQSISVPGRNGNLIIDEGAFDNVLISYPVYEKNSFPMEFDSIVNWLASLEGYQRIECSNDPTHFRLGRFVVPQTPTAKRLNRDGYYQLSFDCKPQRYLNLGEVPTEIDANPSETYGPADIVSFEAAQEDTISGAEFSIVPQQDLHGYDSPWPAGGGKNLWSEDATFSKDNTSTYITKACNLAAGTYTLSGEVTAEEGVTSVRWSFRSATPKSIQLPVGSGRTSVTFELTEPCTQVYVYGQSSTSEQNAATFTDIQVEAGSTATAWTPFANICPITGFTGAEVTGTGINWAKLSEDNKGSNQKSTVVYTEDGATVTATGTYGRMGWLIPVKEGETYTVSLKCSATNYGSSYLNRIFLGNKNAAWSSADDGYITFNVVNTTEGNWSYTFTATTSVLFIGVYITTTATSGSITISNLQVEVGSTATPYIPYVGTTHDITWQDEAGTVYGGSIAYLGGDMWRLTATNKHITATSFADYGQGSSYAYGQILISDASSTSGAPVADFLCSKLKVDATPSAYSCRRANQGVYCYFPLGTAEADASNLISGMDIVYPLATPIVYDLTGEELARIVGQNNVFANCGQSTVVITEPTYFDNPGYFTSKPIIRVYGDGTFRVGDNIITIEEHDEPYIDIDSELQDCYCGDTNMNEYVTFTSGEYPVLVPGSNYVLMGEGITKLVITPNWWEL